MREDAQLLSNTNGNCALLNGTTLLPADNISSSMLFDNKSKGVINKVQPPQKVAALSVKPTVASQMSISCDVEPGMNG